MPKFKISYNILKQNGNKQSSLSKESLLLDQATAESFITQFLQFQKELKEMNINNSLKLKKLGNFLKPYKEKDLSESTHYIEINTLHDVAEDRFEIRSRFPSNL
ncbi:MAG: hypothetical protein EU547_04285 [Promethearchaeota archaeon]|nr:MAG: hypothetical protein EU547_04285 [Candidatus Lokiarchaeota archaeon]